MKAEFLKNQYLILYLHHGGLGIEKILSNIIQIQYRNIKDDDKAKQINAGLRELAVAASKIDTNSIPFSYGFVPGGDLERYLTATLSTISNQALKDFGVSSAFFSAMEGYKKKYDETLQALLNSFWGMSEVGVAALPQDIYEYAFIEIKFPSQLSHSDLEIIGRELSEQARILKVLSDSFGGSREDFLVFSFSSSRLSVLIKTNYQYATHFSAIVFFVLSTANSYLEMRIKSAELYDLLGKPGYQETLSSTIATDISKKCAEKIAQEFFANEDSANFEAEKCALGAKRLFESIERGFRYDVHVPIAPNREQSADVSTSEKRDRLQTLSQEMRIRFDSLPQSEEPLQIEKGKSQ